MSDKYRYEIEERPVEPNTCCRDPEQWAEIADWEASRGDYYKEKADYYEKRQLEFIKNRLPGDYAEQIFNHSDALVQLSNLCTQYHNERIFADDAESILNAVKNIISDSVMIMHINDVLSRRVSQWNP